MNLQNSQQRGEAATINLQNNQRKHRKTHQQPKQSQNQHSRDKHHNSRKFPQSNEPANLFIT